MTKEDLLKKSKKELDKLLKKKVLFVPKRKSNATIETITEVLHKSRLVVCRPLDSRENCLNCKEFLEQHDLLTEKLWRNLIYKNIVNNLKYVSTEVKSDYIYNKLKNTPDFSVISVTPGSEGLITVVIHYPVITITNSAELIHNMLDVYLKIVLTPNLKLGSIQLLRTTFTVEEIACGYQFSHLSSGIRYVSSFCYGTDTFIGNLISKATIDFVSLDYLLFNFKQYLEWESLEGRPYIRIDQIHSNLEDADIDLTLIDFNRLVSTIYNHLSTINYDLDLRNGDYVVELTKDTILNLTAILTEHYPEYNYYIVNNKEKKLEPRTQDYIETILRDRGVSREFRVDDNVTVPLKIVPYSTDLLEKTGYKKRVHSDIVSKIVDLITNDLLSFLITKKNE